MKTTVKIDWLLNKVRENREKHLEVFQKAFEGFKKQVTVELEQRLEILKGGKIPQLYIHLTQPTNQVGDYDRIIAMLEAMTMLPEMKVIELTEDDFAKYVLDKWQWKREWVSNSKAYVKDLPDEE